MIYHKPVLLQSVLHYLAVQPDQFYIDATLGGGGHTSAIIRSGGKVLGLDQDPDALNSCPDMPNLVRSRSNFIHLAQVAKENSWSPVMGILFDLGVSSYQLDQPHRGFSFQRNGPLDMRMDPDLFHSAATLVNTLTVKQLAKVLRDYGEVSRPLSLAHRIVSSRPLTTTGQLAKVISYRDRRQVFQALRIAVNNELEALQITLPQALSLLASQGRLVIITFHSLEDRLVKLTFKSWRDQGLVQILTPKPILPSSSEVAINPHAKSAKLRAIIKL